jgi:hypothetical protein
MWARHLSEETLVASFFDEKTIWGIITIDESPAVRYACGHIAVDVHRHQPADKTLRKASPVEVFPALNFSLP